MSLPPRPSSTPSSGDSHAFNEAPPTPLAPHQPASLSRPSSQPPSLVSLGQAHHPYPLGHPAQPYNMPFHVPSLPQSTPLPQTHAQPHNLASKPANPSMPHQHPKNSPHAVPRTSQQLIHSQPHMRSHQRLIQQQHLHHHQMQQMQRYEEILSLTDPLDCIVNRNLAIRRFQINHFHMNHILGTHWTVPQLLRGEHCLQPHRRDHHHPYPALDSIDQRARRLRLRLEKLTADNLKAQAVRKA